MGPVDAGNGGDKAEAEPIAWSAATPFQPVETLENLLAFIVGNSGPVIDDRHDGDAIILTNLHGHPTRFTAIFDGVVDEIRYSLSPVTRTR
jgi:hypothetical protein